MEWFSLIDEEIDFDVAYAKLQLNLFCQPGFMQSLN